MTAQGVRTTPTQLDPFAEAGPAPLQGPARGVGALLCACAVASVGLLISHPGGSASPVLADVLRAEAAQRIADAIIHGGYVVVLTLELIGFLVLAARVRWQRAPVLAALVFLLVGTGLLAASMIADGLITPAIAVRYVAAPLARQEAARALLVLISAAIGVLMPMGLGFQGLAAVAWASALAPLRRARAAAAIAGVAGLIAVAASVYALVGGPMVALMIALVALAIWVLAAGVLLISWSGGPTFSHARSLLEAD